MESKYAYVDTAGLRSDSSELYIQAWIDRVLQRSQLDQDAKSLINTSTMIPVKFSVSVDPEQDPLIVEWEEVPLWHVLNNHYRWESFPAKGQTSTLTVAPRMPSFFGETVKQMTPARFFMDSIRGIGQSRSLASNPYPLVLPDRSLLKTEIVVCHVWGRQGRLLALFWFDVPPISLSVTQWPRLIGTTWSGLRIGARSGGHVYFSDDPAKNQLWLMPFEETVGDVDFSIVPRWVSKSFDLPGDDLAADQLVEVVISHLPGKTETLTYSVTVPEAHWPLKQWRYYLSLYMNHRCPWVNCGVQDEDDGITARDDQDNQWFIRHDASQAFIEVRIVPAELAQWTQRRPLTGQLPKLTRAWQKWDSLANSVGNVELCKDYVANLVRRSFSKTGLPEGDWQRFSQERQFRYKYLVGYPPHTSGMSAFSPPRYKYFTFEQVVIGEPQRSRFYQEQVSSVHIRGEPISPREMKALSGIRDTLLTEFIDDVDNLSQNAEFKTLFEETCIALARVRVGQFLADHNETDAGLRGAAFRYLKSDLKPRLLLFKEKLLANVFVVKMDSTKALLVSLNLSGHKWAVWQPSTVKGHPTEKLMAFIRAHLPLAERFSLTREDFVPQKKRYGYHYRRFPPQPITFQEVADLPTRLREIAVAEIKQLINYAIFSSDEERRRAKTSMYRQVIRALSGLVIAAIGPLSGMGALLVSGMVRFVTNVGEVGFSYALAQSADRPEEYGTYIQECKLGVLLGVVDLGVDVSTVTRKLRVLLKQSTAAGKTVLPLLTPQAPDEIPLQLPVKQALDPVFMPVPIGWQTLRDRLVKTFRDDNKLSELNGYAPASTSGGYTACVKCSRYLSSKSWGVQAVGVLIFAGLDDQHPTQHFAMCLRHEDDIAIMDIAVSHLDSSAERRIYFGSVSGWEQHLRTLPTLQEKVVVYKFFPSFPRASEQVEALFPLGVSWARFFSTGNYSIVALPQQYAEQVRQQIHRLWTDVFYQLVVSPFAPAEPTEHRTNDLSQTDLFNQISTLNSLVQETEQVLRRTIGVDAVGELRTLLLSYLQVWRAEPKAEYIALMDKVMAEEAAMVQYALTHLETLQSGLPPVLASGRDALVDCIDWIAVRAGQEDDSWLEQLKGQLEQYVSGSHAGVDLHSIAVLDTLYEQLNTAGAIRVRHARSVSYERLSPASGRALFARGLESIRGVEALRQPECYFALILRTQPYAEHNEHLARVVFGISALRQGRFTVLPPSEEFRLSGLEPTESMPV
ncbi:hypothetical protein [Pseudomonas nabeulensis]|nr:hypothetical protein [Pseudomonas nabeulensis]